MENIFADYGNIITGARYIHRKKVESEIIARMLGDEVYGSTALVGMQRTGKSSLAHNLFINAADELIKKNIIVVNIVMYKYSSPESFFRAIVDCTYEVIDENDISIARLEKRYERAISSNISEDGGEAIRSFFKGIRKSGYRVICVIDEFDKAKELFKDFTQGFFILRELAYQPENKVAFLFISRHLMSELEADVGFDVSNFSNILSNNYLGTFTDEECNEYFSLMASAGIDVTDELKEQYLDITGGYPFWMDTLSFYYVTSLINGKNISVKNIFSENQEVFYNEYQKLFDILKDQDLLNSLYQIILGPLGDDATPRQIKRLLNYGIIQEDENGNYHTISKYFRQYMVVKEQVIDFYPLWNRTEKLFRLTGAKALEEKYGPTWEDKLREIYVKEDDSPRGHGKYMSTGDYILAATNQVENMKKNVGTYEINPEEITLFNGTTTGAMFEIIRAEYDCFKDIFKMDRKEFKAITDSITSARNPYDHNNDQLIKADVKQRTNENCSKFVKLMEEYLKLS